METNDKLHFDGLISELKEWKSEESSKDLDDVYDEEVVSIEEEKIVPATVVDVTPKEIYLDIRYKNEAVVSVDEFSEGLPAVGDRFDVFVESLSGVGFDGLGVSVSKLKAEKVRKWEKAIGVLEEGQEIKGVIRRKVKGGMIVDIGVEAFLPLSQFDVRPVSNFDFFVGKEFDFRVVKVNLQRRNVVVSRRVLIEEKRLEERRNLLGSLQKGNIYKGVVKNLTSFGAFVDLGGIDGLLHITDMSWGRIVHPSELLSVGQEIDVMLLEIDEEKQRVSLGIKQKDPNPWQSIKKKYPDGSRVVGKVVNITNYGAFVQVDDVECLLHVSEMSWTRRVNHPSEMLKIGQDVECVVLSVSVEDKKISLGMKQLKEDPWNTISDQYKEGDRVTGLVKSIKDYGVFVDIGNGIDALLHISDMSWSKRVNHPSEILRKGEEVESVILSINVAEKKIAVGLKQLEEDPWLTRVNDIKVGDEVDATIVKLSKYGIFASFLDVFEGLIHKQDIETYKQSEEGQSQALNEGDEIKVYVSSIDFSSKKIALSFFPA